MIDLPEEVYTLQDPVLDRTFEITLDDITSYNDMLMNRIVTPCDYNYISTRPTVSNYISMSPDEVETEESNEDALDVFIGTGFNNIVRYARDHKFEFEEFKDEYERLRALWTSYCIINNFTCEHRKYIPSLKHIYLIIGQNNNMSYDDFVVYMGALFNWRLR